MTALADRLANIKPAVTLAISAKARELTQQGRPIISLSAGEPDFSAPLRVKEAAVKAINGNNDHYTAVDGIPELKQAIINKFKRDNQLDYTADEIIVSGGAKQSIYNAMLALLNADDEVIIPAPYWVSYPEIAKLAEAKPVVIKTTAEQQYKLTPQQLTQHITDKTRLLILNSPNNPSGMVYSHAELKALAEVLCKHPDILIISDDIYEHIYWYDEPFANVITICPELKSRTVVINGLSKSHAMTGWRLGYAAAHADITKGMKKIQGQCTSNTSSITQQAAITALNMPVSELQYMFTEYKKRHSFLHQALNELPGVNCLPSAGTFYSFADFTAVIMKMGLTSDVDLANLLLEKAEIAVVPGSAFGLPNHIRFSYAASQENLQEAIVRLKKFLA